MLHNYRMFADDTLFIGFDDGSEAVDLINKDLDTTSNWADRWIVKCCLSKTETLLVSLKRETNIVHLFISEKTAINEVTSHKHLGMILPEASPAVSVSTIFFFLSNIVFWTNYNISSIRTSGMNTQKEWIRIWNQFPKVFLNKIHVLFSHIWSWDQWFKEWEKLWLYVDEFCLVVFVISYWFAT